MRLTVYILCIAFAVRVVLMNERGDGHFENIWTLKLRCDY